MSSKSEKVKNFTLESADAALILPSEKTNAQFSSSNMYLSDYTKDGNEERGRTKTRADVFRTFRIITINNVPLLTMIIAAVQKLQLTDKEGNRITCSENYEIENMEDSEVKHIKALIGDYPDILEHCFANIMPALDPKLQNQLYCNFHQYAFTQRFSELFGHSHFITNNLIFSQSDNVSRNIETAEDGRSFTITEKVSVSTLKLPELTNQEIYSIDPSEGIRRDSPFHNREVSLTASLEKNGEIHAYFSNISSTVIPGYAELFKESLGKEQFTKNHKPVSFIESEITQKSISKAEISSDIPYGDAIKGYFLEGDFAKAYDRTEKEYMDAKDPKKKKVYENMLFYLSKLKVVAVPLGSKECYLAAAARYELLRKFKSQVKEHLPSAEAWYTAAEAYYAETLKKEFSHETFLAARSMYEASFTVYKHTVKAKDDDPILEAAQKDLKILDAAYARGVDTAVLAETFKMAATELKHYTRSFISGDQENSAEENPLVGAGAVEVPMGSYQPLYAPAVVKTQQKALIDAINSQWTPKEIASAVLLGVGVTLAVAGIVAVLVLTAGAAIPVIGGIAAVAAAVLAPVAIPVVAGLAGAALMSIAASLGFKSADNNDQDKGDVCGVLSKQAYMLSENAEIIHSERVKVENRASCSAEAKSDAESLFQVPVTGAERPSIEGARTPPHSPIRELSQFGLWRDLNPSEAEEQKETDPLLASAIRVPNSHFAETSASISVGGPRRKIS